MTDPMALSCVYDTLYIYKAYVYKVSLTTHVGNSF